MGLVLDTQNVSKRAFQFNAILESFMAFGMVPTADFFRSAKQPSKRIGGMWWV
jgi:hypothetical protein